MKDVSVNIEIWTKSGRNLRCKFDIKKGILLYIKQYWECIQGNWNFRLLSEVFKELYQVQTSKNLKDAQVISDNPLTWSERR